MKGNRSERARAREKKRFERKRWNEMNEKKHSLARTNKKKTKWEKRRWWLFFYTFCVVFLPFSIKRNGYWHSNSMFWYVCVVTFDFLLCEPDMNYYFYSIFTFFLLFFYTLYGWCVHFSILECYALGYINWIEKSMVTPRFEWMRMMKKCHFW